MGQSPSLSKASMSKALVGEMAWSNQSANLLGERKAGYTFERFIPLVYLAGSIATSILHSAITQNMVKIQGGNLLFQAKIGWYFFLFHNRGVRPKSPVGTLQNI